MSIFFLVAPQGQIRPISIIIRPIIIHIATILLSMATSAWVPTFGGCWEAGAGVVTVHTSMTWSMGGGTWSFTSQMSSLRNFVSRFKYSLSFSDSSTPVCSGLWLALQENCRELGLKMLTLFFFSFSCNT